MLEIKNIKDVEDDENLKDRFILSNFLPLSRDSISLLIGKGGSGKSMIALQMAIRFIEENEKPVFLWLSEDPMSESKKRVDMLCEFLFYDKEKIYKYLYISNSKPVEIAKKTGQNFFITNEFNEVKKLLFGYDFIVLDPLKSFTLNLEENSNSDMDKVMKELAFWAKDESKSILIIHHSSKTGGARGASAIIDASRLAYEVLPTPIQNVKNIKILKDNFGVSHLLKTQYIKIKTGENNE